MTNASLFFRMNVCLNDAARVDHRDACKKKGERERESRVLLLPPVLTLLTFLF